MDRKMDLGFSGGLKPCGSDGPKGRMPPKSPMRSSIDSELQTNLERMTEQVSQVFCLMMGISILSL